MAQGRRQFISNSVFVFIKDALELIFLLDLTSLTLFHAQTSYGICSILSASILEYIIRVSVLKDVNS